MKLFSLLNQKTHRHNYHNISYYINICKFLKFNQTNLCLVIYLIFRQDNFLTTMPENL